MALSVKRTFRKVLRILRKSILITIGAVLGLVFLVSGPIVINYMFITETTGWDFDLAFSAGEMLQYYGAVLGGIVTCFAIITTINVNNKNRKQDLQRQQFERAYAIYHKLPEILTKLEMAAIQVQYSIHLEEEKLIETLDTMKESESILREYRYENDIYYSKEIESIVQKILAASVRCQESVENYFENERHTGKDSAYYHKVIEDTFIDLRESIKKARSKVLAEINQFVSDYNQKS